MEGWMDGKREGEKEHMLIILTGTSTYFAAAFTLKGKEKENHENS